MANNFNIPRKIYLYDESAKDVDFKELEAFVRNNFGKFAVKIIKLKEKIVSTKGLIFDFIKTKEAFDKFLKSSQTSSKSNDACHIIITHKLFATYDEDKKLHIRASIYSFPSVISLSGIVEGPAKPKEYYVYKDKFSKLGVWPIEEPKIKKKFKLRFIDYADKRMTKVLKGYISQVVFFYLIGDPFCDDRKCRLFNAHWQEDLIYAQIKMGGFCPRHKDILSILKNA